MNVKRALSAAFNALTGKGHSELYKANASAAQCGLGAIGAFALAASPVAAAAATPLFMPALLVASFTLAIGSMLNLAVAKSMRLEEKEKKAAPKKAALTR